MNIDFTISISDIIGWGITILGFYYTNQRINNRIKFNQQNGNKLSNSMMAGGDITNVK